MALGGAEGETEASFRELSAPRCHVATGLSSTCSAPSPPTVGPGLQPEKPPQGGPVGLHGRGVPGGRRVRGAGGQVASLSTGAALAPSFSVYCVCRCFCGSGMSGLVLNGLGLGECKGRAGDSPGPGPGRLARAAGWALPEGQVPSHPPWGPTAPTLPRGPPGSAVPCTCPPSRHLGLPGSLCPPPARERPGPAGMRRPLSPVLEWTPPSRRAAVSGLLSFVLSLGQLNLALLAFGLRHWRHLQLAAGAPFALCFLCGWWLPESVRWLAVRGRLAEALRSLKLVSWINRVPAAGSQLSLEMLGSHYSQEEAAGAPGAATLDLFRTREMLALLACIMGIWFSASLAFFSLALDIQRFPGEDPYLVQVVLGVVDLPFRLLVPKLADYLGRRLTLASCMLLGGGLLLGAIPVPEELGRLHMGLAVLSKGLMSASLSCIVLVASEVFPTSLRMTGMGVTNMVGHLGGVTAPLVLLAGPTLPLLPPVLFGATVLAASCLIVFLPETRGAPLPDTLEQAQSQVRRCWSRLLRKPRRGAQPLQTKL
ncbi:solute carrier family 22 member 20-like isoform 3-T3 [Sarcophilus harrisii]